MSLKSKSTLDINVLDIVPNLQHRFASILQNIPQSASLQLKPFLEGLYKAYSKPNLHPAQTNPKHLNDVKTLLSVIKQQLDLAEFEYTVTPVKFRANLFTTVIDFISDIELYSKSVKQKAKTEINMDLVTKVSAKLDNDVTAKTEQKAHQSVQDSTQQKSAVVVKKNTKPSTKTTLRSKTQLVNVQPALQELVHLMRDFPKDHSVLPQKDFLMFLKIYHTKLALSAYDRGIPFTLTENKLKTLLETKKCFYTGVPLTPNNFTVDRIECDEGYTNTNCVACTYDANQLKSLTIEAYDIPTVMLEKLVLLRAKKALNEPDSISLNRART